MIAASGLGRAKVDPAVAWVGCAVALAVAGELLANASSRPSWVVYTLVADLWRAAVLLWAGLLVWAGLEIVSPRLRRSGLPFGHLLAGPPWGRSARRAWAVGIGGALLLVLLPGLQPGARHGLSSRVVREWRSPGDDIQPRRVTGLHFDGSPQGWTGRPLLVTIDGWLYAPVAGDYDFRLAALGDALLEIDGAPIVGLGDHEAELTLHWATDPDGARRVLTRLQTGFHRIGLFYRRPAGAAHLTLRWTVPDTVTHRAIPASYLLPGDASLATRRWQGLLLAGRRAGVLALALLLAVRLTHFVVGAGRSPGGAAPS
jgi:hypothetical protein